MSKVTKAKPVRRPLPEGEYIAIRYVIEQTDKTNIEIARLFNRAVSTVTRIRACEDFDSYHALIRKYSSSSNQKQSDNQNQRLQLDMVAALEQEPTTTAEASQAAPITHAALATILTEIREDLVRIERKIDNHSVGNVLVPTVVSEINNKVDDVTEQLEKANTNLLLFKKASTENKQRKHGWFKG